MSYILGKNSVGTFDFETDPFCFGNVIRPFAACIYFGNSDLSIIWESDSERNFLQRVISALRRLPECTLYAHNGGKFDFHFLLEYANTQRLTIYGSRVLEMKIGKVTLKDSFPLMPFALEEFKKTKIDYEIFRKRKRNIKANREKITNYLIDDCRNLLELVTGFRSIVGAKDTIGSAAFYQMKEFGIEIEHCGASHDNIFRPYYFGGRVQAFSKGIFTGRYKYLDINSAYPFAMLENHPHGTDYRVTKRLPPLRKLGAQFIHCIARSAGALPVRDEDSADFETLTFPMDKKEREFYATGWEIKAGIETKTLEMVEIIECWEPEGFINFREFVQEFYARRLNAKKEGNEIARLAYKYLLNSGYGKFAQNPEKFKEWKLAPYGKNVPGYDWSCDFGNMSLWERPLYRGIEAPKSWSYYDVATGSSVTGFVRAMLWRAVCGSRTPLYIDTDALICKDANVAIGDKLGDWKLEGCARRVAIAGKKLYGVEWEKSTPEGKYKIASKGARLKFADIIRLCEGGTVRWKNDAPTFSLGNIHYIEREIRAT